MNYKDMVMYGLIIGIGLFFVGAIINNAFPSTETDLLSYKVSGFIKLLGIGMVTTSMVIGGIIMDQADKNLRTLLLLLGLVLVIIYSVASPSLEWRLSSGSSGADTGYSQRPTGYGVPGFELVGVIGALICTLLLLGRIRKKEK